MEELTWLKILLKLWHNAKSTSQETYWVVVSNILYIYSNLGKIPILTNIFQRGLKSPTSLQSSIHGSILDETVFLGKSIWTYTYTLLIWSIHRHLRV